MGTWGTGISSNDTYSDIYREFIDLYNDGVSTPEITKKLIADNQETISTREDSTNFWFAIANGQWECKELDKEIFSKVEKIVNSGMDIEIWQELDSTQSDIKKREQVLTKFLEKIKTEKAKVKRAKNFSKLVLAMIFPIVFKPNSTKKAHKVIFTAFIEISSLMYFPFINRIENSKRLMMIEMLSKTYISVSFFSLPPQVIS